MTKYELLVGILYSKSKPKAYTLKHAIYFLYKKKHETKGEEVSDEIFYGDIPDFIFDYILEVTRISKGNNDAFQWAIDQAIFDAYEHIHDIPKYALEDISLSDDFTKKLIDEALTNNPGYVALAPQAILRDIFDHAVHDVEQRLCSEVDIERYMT